jgi:hypothetical protein
MCKLSKLTFCFEFVVQPSKVISTQQSQRSRSSNLRFFGDNERILGSHHSANYYRNQQMDVCKIKKIYSRTKS